MSKEPGRHGIVPDLRELVVIIVGVLIAMGVDNWNDGRRDRALETQYLSALEADLRSDSLAFQRTFLPRLVRKDSALSAIAPVVRGAPLVGDTLDFLDVVALGGVLGTESRLVLNRRATYDELLATGNLSLLRSHELRTALVEYYMQMGIASARMLSRIADYPLFVHQYYPAEMRDEKTPAEVRAFGVRRAVQAFRSPAFEALMDQEINAMYFFKVTFERAAEETDDMLRMVEAARTVSARAGRP